MAVPPAAETASVSDGAATDAQAPEDESENDAIAIEPERFVLLTAGGPLIVHVEVTIDGQPQRAAADEALAAAMKVAEDGTAAEPAWSSLVEHPKFTSGELGNMALADATARTRAARDYDANNDQRVQRAELAAFLSRDTSGGQGSAIRWIADRVAHEKWSSPLFVLLDADGDGRLTLDECAAAPVRLRSRDVDDNDAVTLADFRPPELPRSMANYRTDPPPTRGYALQQYALDSLYYTLSELYNANYGLMAEQFEFAPDLFSLLDVDQSGRVEQRELAGLLEARPDLLVRASFATDAPPKLSLVKLADALSGAGANVEVANERLLIGLNGCQIDFVAVDAADNAGRLAEAQGRFAALDVNGDLALDAEELAASDPPVVVEFARLDADGDGKLAVSEALGALADPANYRDRQLHVLLGEQSDALFGWLDQRPDGRLTSRELSNAGQRLAQLDTNGDGLIAAGEIPERISCVIQLGGAIDSRATTLPLPSAGSAVLRDVPRWLSAMDRNGDGEISRREFLGSAEQFDRLDTNADGFLDAAEALAAEPRAVENAADATPSNAGS